MFHLFKKKPTVTLDDLTITDLNWELTDSTDLCNRWMPPARTNMLSVNFFEKKPDLPYKKGLAGLRDFYRERVVENKGGILLVDCIEMHNMGIIKTVFKIPQEENGMYYVGSYTIPFERCSYVIKIEAPELGATGMRESVVVAQSLLSNPNFDPENTDEGWKMDPYDENFTEGNPMNLSEKEEYDAQFPEHPLSQLRSYMRKTEASIEFSEALKQLKPFYPAGFLTQK